MSMVGTFDGFTAARLGLYAAQHGLRVTGNNVANINTSGYTRQRVDQMSFKAGANDMYRSQYDNHVGSGALVTGINQVRDPYLDIRYRNASTDTYHYDTWLSGLQNIASILDEVGKGDNKDGLIYKAIQDLAEKMRAYSANPTSLNDRLVRNSAESLTLLFHNAADRLEKLYNETVNEFNEDVSAVNEILTNIRDLNKSIREAEIHGDHALEMRDERNRQIDALSQYLDIKVEYSYETVGGGIEVEKLTIRLNNANPDISVHTDESVLVDGVFATQLSVPKERPVINTYGDQYWYLKGFKYLKKIAANEEALQKYFDKNGLKLEDFLRKETAEDGTQYYIVGTKDPDKAAKGQLPVRNTYPAADDDKYQFMAGYKYIRKIPAIDASDDEAAALQQFLEKHQLTDAETDLIKVGTGDDAYYIIGTDDPKAYTEEQPIPTDEYDDAYLEGYPYIMKIPVDPADDDDDALTLEQYLADNPNSITLSKLLMSNNPFITEESEDGTEVIYFLLGANDSDVDGIYTEPNDNFTIQLGKLLNAKGEEWKSTTTTWVDVTSLDVKTYNTWSYTLESTLTDEDGNNTFVITDSANNKITYKIVADADYDENGDTDTVKQVRLSEVNSDTKLAKFIAQKLEESGRYQDDYTVSSKGNRIIFTAKEPVDDTKKPDDGTEDPDTEANGPNLTVEGTGIKLGTRDTGTTTVTSPKGIDLNEYPKYEYDEHGNVTKSVEYVQIEGKWYQLTIGATYTHEVTLDDNDLHGILQAERELLTEEGEFSSAKDVSIDESALIKRGIPYYIKSLDLLAQKFAEAYNQLNTGYAFNQDGNYIDKDGYPLMLEDASTDPPERKHVSVDGLTRGQQQYLIGNGYFLQDEQGNAIDEKGNIITDANGNPITADMVDSLSQTDYNKLVADFDKWMTDNDAIPMGGGMFTNLDGETTTGITAKTISISHGWSNGLWNLVPTFMMLFTDSGGLTHSTQNDNADHMVAMIDKALTYNPRDLYGSDAIGPELFKGSFNDMLSNMMAVQGEDASITNVRLTTYATSLNELDYSREGVSGVDLNDEAMNMVTYQKAMSAAMRVITAIDEMLDRLINNTGIAGR